MRNGFHAIIHGRVQGVSFRYYTRNEAISLGIRGMVRNLPDGTLEVRATGEESALHEFVSWLHHGPDFARVEKLDLAWRVENEVFDDFSIRH